jgi:hypothetical protein
LAPNQYFKTAKKDEMIDYKKLNTSTMFSSKKHLISPMPKLTLIDINVYFDEDDDIDTEDDKKYKNHYRREFFTYLNNLFTIAYGEHHGFNVKDVFDVEFEILNAMACELIKETDPDDYNLIKKEEALRYYGFNW